MIRLDFEPERVKIVCDPATKLTGFSFALEQAVNWFFGKGVTHFKASRSKTTEGKTECLVEAKMPSRKLLFSQATPLSHLCMAGYWPQDLRPEEMFQVPGDKHEIRQGHQRYLEANQEFTVMRSFGLDPKIYCGVVAYGVSDLFTGFFWLGATWIQHQLSLGTIQTQFNKGFDKRELENYIRDPGEGYDLEANVNSLT